MTIEEPFMRVIVWLDHLVEVLKELIKEGGSDDFVSHITHLLVCVAPCLVVEIAIGILPAFILATILAFAFFTKEGYELAINNQKQKPHYIRDCLGDLAGPVFNYLVFLLALLS